MQDNLIIRSRAILPIDRPPIFNGALVMHGDKILAVDDWAKVRREFVGTVLDLGEQVMLPGLINAHCHLDYTLMAGKLKNPTSFTSWIQSMIKQKRAWNEKNFQDSWISGYQKLIQSGTTLVADTVSHPSRFDPRNLPRGPRLFPFYELIHLQDTPLDENDLTMSARHAALFEKTKGDKAGISPHAPYTTSPELWRSLKRAPTLCNLPFSMHLSESIEEYDLFKHRKGPMFEWFNSIKHLPEWGTGSPIQLMDQAGILKKNGIAVHVNCLDEGDVERLVQNNMHIVHCPRSHAYFAHPTFQINDLQSKNLNIALGTDSLASVTDEDSPGSLSLFDEMRKLLEGENAVKPESILKMSTLNGAKALGLQGEAGSLEAGKRADWISLPWNGKKESLAEHAIGSLEPVSCVFLGGKEISG